MKLTSIFSNQQILTTPGTHIPKTQINSNQVQNLKHSLLKHLDKLNLAAITPQNIFPNQKTHPTLQEHLLNILIFRDHTGNPITIYNPIISSQSGQQFTYERCGSIQINKELTFDCYTKRADIITVSGYNYSKIHNGETAAYIQHEIDHLNGITISDRNKELSITQLTEMDEEIKPKLIIKVNGQYKLINRTNKNKNTQNSISFDYIEEFHNGIEKEIMLLE
jgi:peptide deformylase